MAEPVRILHLHSTFSLGGKEARAVRLMNALGEAAHHSVLSAVPDAIGAREAIDPAVRVAFPKDAPPLAGRLSIARYRALAAYMRGFDLVLSYNWGAMDGVMARRLLDGPPLIHHEDGFNEDEAERLNTARNLFRRAAFPAAERIIVPSVHLEEIALRHWRQPRGRVLRIPNGIPVGHYTDAPRADAIPGFVRQPGEVVIGTVAGLRAVKDLPRLVRALARLPSHVRLIIVGEGPEREAIAAEAARLGVADRVLLPGFLDRPHRFVGHFDIFALSSLSEQFPISVLEAMAAGLPIVSPDVGDVAAIVAEPNRPFIAADETDFRHAFDQLCRDSALRGHIGAANRERARARFDEDAMITAYRALYARAAGRETL